MLGAAIDRVLSERRLAADHAADLQIAYQQVEIEADGAMNEALALVIAPATIEATQEIWQDYSGRWQFRNQIRTEASGLAVLLAGAGLLRIR